MDPKTLLVTALVLSATQGFKALWTWRTGRKPENGLTVGFATALGFLAYLGDAAYPWLFGDVVVQAFTQAVALPGVLSFLSEFVKKGVSDAPPSPEVEV